MIITRVKKDITVSNRAIQTNAILLCVDDFILVSELSIFVLVKSFNLQGRSPGRGLSLYECLNKNAQLVESQHGP